MPISQQQRILIAPLDWGLGHTARCVPLIRYVQALGHIPVVACNDWQKSFVRETFGPIDIADLDGYNISYSPANQWMQIGLLRQLPAIHKKILAEHKWLLRRAEELHIDRVISDNRYGLHHPAIPSVILTHQLMVQSGAGVFADRAIQKLHYKYLNRFGETWVVDTQGINNMAGILSNPAVMPRKFRYIGLLSRFSNRETAATAQPSRPENILILLSGPEPQRTILSQMLWNQAAGYQGDIAFVEGSSTARQPANIPTNIQWHQRLTDSALAPLLDRADIIICRSGYSTLMDLTLLRKRAIVIPTPGQTEQEYLGRYLHGKGFFYCSRQKGFNLDSALAAARDFLYSFTIGVENYDMYKDAIDTLISGKSPG